MGKGVVPILTCVFSTLNWLTLTPKVHFAQFYLKANEVTLYFLSWGKNKYVTLGMRLLWKYKKKKKIKIGIPETNTFSAITFKV